MTDSGENKKDYEQNIRMSDIRMCIVSDVVFYRVLKQRHQKEGDFLYTNYKDFILLPQYTDENLVSNINENYLTTLRQKIQKMLNKYELGVVENFAKLQTRRVDEKLPSAEAVVKQLFDDLDSDAILTPTIVFVNRRRITGRDDPSLNEVANRINNRIYLFREAAINDYLKSQKANPPVPPVAPFLSIVTAVTTLSLPPLS